MQNGLHFTVACSTNGSMDLTREMNMIKPILLYADKINLISPSVYTSVQVEKIFQCQNERDILMAFKQVNPYVAMVSPKTASDYDSVFQQAIPILNSVKYKAFPFVKKLKFRKGLLASIDMAKKALSNSIGVQNEKDIKKLVSKGVLTVTSFDSSLYNSSQMTQEYISLISAAMQSSHSVLDDDAYALMFSFAGKETLMVNQYSEDRVKHAGLASNILSTIPSLDYASIDELLDIKKTLSIPLQRFRSSLLNYSKTLNEIPWNDDFEHECYALYLSEISPKIVEIEELMHDNSYIVELMAKFIDDKHTWAQATTLAVGIAANGVLATLQKAIHFDSALYAAGGVFALEKIANSYLDYKKKNDEIKKKDMYFYVKAKQHLSR